MKINIMVAGIVLAPLAVLLVFGMYYDAEATAAVVIFVVLAGVAVAGLTVGEPRRE